MHRGAATRSSSPATTSPPRSTTSTSSCTPDQVAALRPAGRWSWRSTHPDYREAVELSPATVAELLRRTPRADAGVRPASGRVGHGVPTVHRPDAKGSGQGQFRLLRCVLLPSTNDHSRFRLGGRAVPVKDIDWRQLGACRGLDPAIFYPETDEEADERQGRLRAAAASALPAWSTRCSAARSRASGAAPPSGSVGGSSASAAARPEPPLHELTWPTSAAGPRSSSTSSSGRDLTADAAPRRHGRDPGRRGHAGPAGGVRRRPAHEGRDGRRAERDARRHARGRQPGQPAGATWATGPSTSSAPVATAATASTSPPWPPSSSPGPACRCASTATGPRRPAAGPPTCSRRSASPSTCRRTGVARCVEEAGIGFCLAPRFHPALRHAGPARREMGIPTAFNILGPLANPGRVRRMLLGVADAVHGRADAGRAARARGRATSCWSTATTGSTS